MSDVQGRPNADRAWNMLVDPVKEALEQTDHAAVVTTLVRFAVQAHMSATNTIGNDGGKGIFQDIVDGCYERTIADCARVKTSS